MVNFVCFTIHVFAHVAPEFWKKREEENKKNEATLIKRMSTCKNYNPASRVMYRAFYRGITDKLVLSPSGLQNTDHIVHNELFWTSISIAELLANMGVFLTYLFCLSESEILWRADK
eukprot:UN27018